MAAGGGSVFHKKITEITEEPVDLCKNAGRCLQSSQRIEHFKECDEMTAS